MSCNSSPELCWAPGKPLSPCEAAAGAGRGQEEGAQKQGNPCKGPAKPAGAAPFSQASDGKATS